jgi:hypothetical protein
MVKLLLLAGLGAALAGSSASASPSLVRWFHSPSGNISCEVGANRPQIGTYAFCATRSPTRCVRLDGKGQMRVRRGLPCEGDAPETAFTLGYGKSVRVGPFRCTSRMDGMRCAIVVTGHGFLISRERVTRF